MQNVEMLTAYHHVHVEKPLLDDRQIVAQNVQLAPNVLAQWHASEIIASILVQELVA